MKKISVVSGGSGGLGFAIAEHLLRSGKDVLILGRSGEKLTMAGKKLSRTSKTAHISTLVCNIGDESDVRKTGKFLNDHKLSLNICSIMQAGDYLQMPPPQHQR
jgi:NAD(P)-dependent dehydrogenase (short-subunit alcohol dehydrogenase family)